MGEQPHSWSTPADAVVVADPATATARQPRAWFAVVLPWAALVLVLVLVLGGRLNPSGGAGTQPWVPGSPLSVEAGGARPTPQKATAQHPLGVPRAAPAVPGPYAFLARQRSGDPIAYDPCRTIPYVVNTRTAPSAAKSLVADAIEHMHDVTGLNFVSEGVTDEHVSGMRAPFQPDRYGDRWAPVLITWSDETEFPELAGDVAGLGGSTPLFNGLGPAVYVSGIVVLDGPQIDDIIHSSYTGKLQARAIVVHELGHLVGLDHVDDPSQLMNGTGGTVDLQSGDLAGLAQLGAGPCVPRL